jgi:protein O-GlcNAc transferase
MSQAQAVQKTFERGVAQHRAGRLDDAAKLYEQVLRQDARHEQALFLSAAIALETGRAAQALQALERLVERHPANAVYWTNLGEAHRRLEDYERAAAALTRAVTIKPDLAQAHFNLGLVTRQLAEPATALQAFERAAELKPDDARIQHGLATALAAAGEHARAIGHFQCALVQNPSAPQLLLDYASCLRRLRRLDAALVAAQRALELEPSRARAHHERSATLTEQGRFDEAIQSSQTALALEPDAAELHAGLAAALTDTGQLDAALVAYRRAVELDASDHLTHGNLAFLEAFRAGSSAESVLREARAWNDRHAAPLLAHVRAHANIADPERRLRVGYVSSNFNDHCQALFTLPLLGQHDRRAFELVAYSNTTKRDRVTSQLRAHFDQWHDITDLDAVAAAEQIRAHGVDILVDLTMHMAISQLRIFACKPAPVQIAWLAYPGTTGLSTMDYRVTDRHLDPPEAPTPAYSEASLTLQDTFWCYAPGQRTPDVSELPARANGYVTFGCLNSFWKLNESTLQRWARVLLQVERSRLLLLAPDGQARARLLETLGGFGVAAERVELVSRRPRLEYLALYGRIDVCLDTLPYNGHTTSLDALWMGVPVVSRVGETVVGRAGLCQARNLDLLELVAHTDEEFVSAAARLVGDLERLAQLRSSLRRRLDSSPLMDAKRFAQQLEGSYREAWRRWCQRGT